MKTKFSRRDFLRVSLVSLGTAFLAACGRLFKLTPTASYNPPGSLSEPFTPQPTVPQVRPTPVPYVTTEPYAYYDFADSFEGISDLAAYGISSSQNTVKVNGTNYNTLYRTGHQSLEANGTIAGSSGSSIDIEFDVQKLLGASTFDFSNKVIVIAVFIPADSPIDEIVFETDRSDKRFPVNSAKITLNPHVSYQWTATLPKGQWVEAVIDIKDAVSNNPLWLAWDSHGQLSDTEALEVVKNCDVFNIQGRREKDGSASPTYFLLDDLRWLERDRINIDPNADSLRKYAASTHLKLGSSMDYVDSFSIVDAKLCQALTQELNTAMPDTWTWSDYELSEGVFDFARIDAMLDFALGNHLAVFGYTGAQNSFLPEWIKKKSFSELGPILTNYIDKVVGHCKGKIAFWTIFNEVLNDAGDGFRNRSYDPQLNAWAYSPWVDGSDTSLIKAAFRQAHISDPNAILILNDFNTEEIGRQRSEFFYKFVSSMLAEGVSIDGVGFEMHIYYPPEGPRTDWESPRILDLPAYLSAVDASVKRYAALGLKVAFSEVDVPIYVKDIDPSTTSGQAELTRRFDYEGQIFGGLMKVALANPNVIAFKTQDLVDRYSWVYRPDPYGAPDYGYPDMLDKDYQPKPAYAQVLNALKNGK